MDIVFTTSHQPHSAEYIQGLVLQLWQTCRYGALGKMQAWLQVKCGIQVRAWKCRGDNIGLVRLELKLAGLPSPTFTLQFTIVAHIPTFYPLPMSSSLTVEPVNSLHYDRNGLSRRLLIWLVRPRLIYCNN